MVNDWQNRSRVGDPMLTMSGEDIGTLTQESVAGAVGRCMSDSSSLVEYDQRHAKGGYGPPLISTVLYNRPVRSKKIDYDVVREIALALPDVEESTIHGAPSLKVRGRLLACPAIHRSAEPNTLALRLDFDQRKKLIADKPSVYYVTDHYVNYPTVLVRLSRIERNPLMELLGLSWRFVSSKTKTSKRKGRN